MEGEMRFRMEMDKQWPNFWSLYHWADGQRCHTPLATEISHWDLVALVETGQVKPVAFDAAKAVITATCATAAP
ncbi:hypothetical protein [Burkholderia sp. Ac-20365]|uniref:hypothetical protein n=1 Tax=Burkholderia sp. Ac-20365 TaxID=2703897 RepID=UPI00197B2F0C|nr:hypothetical protein [Burkholderia sp. Ac-20365]MBN3761345.1 hypothetical protein [Burkholderia sp. Ac-20365]